MALIDSRASRVLITVLIFALALGFLYTARHTLVAFLFDSPLLRPMAWATGAIAIYAIWDYYRVAPHAGRRVGQ